jgi:hypothetical protein
MFDKKKESARPKKLSREEQVEAHKMAKIVKLEGSIKSRKAAIRSLEAEIKSSESVLSQIKRGKNVEPEIEAPVE